jgi:predicted DNA-binding transcriptional regulator
MVKSNKELAVEIVAAYWAGYCANPNPPKIVQEFTSENLKNTLKIAYAAVISLPDKNTEN